jgi:hypothetical protein
MVDRGELEQALNVPPRRPTDGRPPRREPCGGAELRPHPGYTLRVVSLLPAPAAEPCASASARPSPSSPPPTIPPEDLRIALRCAVREAYYADQCVTLDAERRRLAGEITKLNRIGIALSAERDPERLLELHPHHRPRLHQLSDAGSLYILERDDEGNGRLRFTSSQNDSLPNLELVKFAIPVSKSTLAGYVAVTGEPLNIPNVYEIDPRAEYSFNPAFDQRTGYRTRSMLVLPMKNQENRSSASSS